MHSPSETRATTYRQMLASLWSIGMAVSLPCLICGSNTMIHNRIWTLMALVDLYFSIETRPWPVTWQSKLSIYLKKKKKNNTGRLLCTTDIEILSVSLHPFYSVWLKDRLTCKTQTIFPVCFSWVPPEPVTFGNFTFYQICISMGSFASQNTHFTFHTAMLCS